MSDPRFLLRFKLDRKPNRGRPDETLERPRLVLGSRPLADIHVADRLVAQEALAFEFDGTRLRIEVLTPLAGVFLNGVPADGAGVVPSGAAIQVGHVLVEAAVDAAQAVCTLTVGERYLSKTVEDAAKKAQADFALVEEGPQEQRWGRSPHIRRWSWLAAALGLAALGSSCFLRESEAMSRGELHRVHAVGAKDGPESCSSCHDDFSSDYGPLCAKCHEGYDGEANHPYARAAESGCADCHSEHRGADADLLPPMRPGADGWPVTCAACHAGESLEAKSKTAGADAAIGGRLRDRPGGPVERALQVDGFAHSDHRVAKPRRIGFTGSAAAPEGTVPVPCGKCHARRAPDGGESGGASGGGGSGSEFALVAYEKCLECHADWRVDVHGRDQAGVHCFQCHAKTDDVSKIAKDVRTATVVESKREYRLPPRKHDFAKDECRKCHVTEKPAPRPQETPALVFRHDHHLRAVAPPKGGELDLSATCVPCHKPVAESDSLGRHTGPMGSVDLSVCKTCHTDGDPVPRVPGKLDESRESERIVHEQRTIVDMAHAVHTVEPGVNPRGSPRTLSGRESLGDGCLSCHVPVVGTERMGLRRGVKDCTACHSGHEHLGGGKCVLCHVDRASAANRAEDGTLLFRRNEPGIFDLAKATVKRTQEVKLFDHFSPGHVAPATDATGAGCADCHDAAPVDAAARVVDVPWPGHADRGCVECHVRTRFHR